MTDFVLVLIVACLLLAGLAKLADSDRFAKLTDTVFRLRGKR